jgi:hypothetical protein
MYIDYIPDEPVPPPRQEHDEQLVLAPLWVLNAPINKVTFPPRSKAQVPYNMCMYARCPKEVISHIATLPWTERVKLMMALVHIHKRDTAIISHKQFVANVEAVKTAREHSELLQIMFENNYSAPSVTCRRVALLFFSKFRDSVMRDRLEHIMSQEDPSVASTFIGGDDMTPAVRDAVVSANITDRLEQTYLATLAMYRIAGGSAAMDDMYKALVVRLNMLLGHLAERIPNATQFVKDHETLIALLVLHKTTLPFVKEYVHSVFCWQLTDDEVLASVASDAIMQ